MQYPVWYFWAVVGWSAVALLTFVYLFRTVAPFGRHSSEAFGPLIPNRIGWILMESPAVWLMTMLVFAGPFGCSPVPLVVLCLFQIHYVYRTLIFPFRIRSKGKKMPLMIAGSAFFFQIINCGLNGYALGWLGESYSVSWFTDIRFISGAALFLGGMILNHWADQKLITLRKPGETGYKIPRGGLFEQVSCPNFLGEIIEWAGFALMCWNIAAVSFWIWTVANLVPRAWAHHKWYREKFPDYPANRKAVIPYVF